MAARPSAGDDSHEALPVAFTGGGTAGHVFPGLAVAARLGRRIFWIGSTLGVERQFVAAAGVDYRAIPAGKLRRYLSVRNLTDLAKTAAGIVAALRVFNRDRPALLFSKGGFVSVPPVIAAWLRGIPAWTHESDFDPGLATKINMRFCEKVLVSFPETLDFIPADLREKAVVTGNPVRGALYEAQPRRGREFVGCGNGQQMLLVIGGSLGSSFVNSLISRSLPRLLSRFFVVHQMGAREFVSAKRENYFPAPFFKDELPDIMAASDVVISRAGANTLAEIATLGKPSILIPLPSTGSRGDQLRNAAFFRARGASVVLEEQEATPEALVSAVEGLFDGTEARAEMSRCAARIGEGRPDKTIADMLLARLG
jgi:UDP-N-acetylglucosamine--N-acetylmuramyl-(pentapeptide) pyrophosphoryl-undecaprenol N-acetylglucosamine transferase